MPEMHLTFELAITLIKLAFQLLLFDSTMLKSLSLLFIYDLKGLGLF